VPEATVAESAPPKFGPQSKIREVVERLGDRGRELLSKHGYDVGEGFVDVLSQYQTLEHAWLTERLRELEKLLEELNTAQ
jgi:DNA-binding HxlR family transcriptional regulator